MALVDRVFYNSDGTPRPIYTDEGISKSENPGHSAPGVNRAMLTGSPIPGTTAPTATKRGHRTMQAHGPTTGGAPGSRIEPMINRETGAPISWSEHRSNQQAAKNDPEGKARKLSVGATVHFAHQGEIVHGKVKAWGKAGARIVTKQGEEYEMPYQHLNLGRHHSVPMVKSADGWHENERIRPVKFPLDDLREHMVVVFAAQKNGRPLLFGGEVIAVGRTRVAVECELGLVELRADEVLEAGWPRP